MREYIKIKEPLDLTPETVFGKIRGGGMTFTEFVAYITHIQISSMNKAIDCVNEDLRKGFYTDSPNP